ncbi:MAG: CCA tRNA nucleotidyltransferase [Acidobacteriaceae bacterium]
MLAHRAAVEVVRTLRSRGHQAYLVGGCVRDLLLGRDPADFDVSTDATPDQVMRIFPQTYAVGAQFGVVLIPFKTVGVDGALAEGEELTADPPKVVEVATFRSDGAYSDGRHPDAVRYTTDPREDVQRRDFTINGLMLDPLDGQHVLDYVDGQLDLQRHLIRTIGDPERRFREDKLRMMRAVRFAARFEYEIDPSTFAAIQRLAPEIHQVSRERQREELTKMLTEGHARRAFELLDATGLLQEVLPEIEKMKGVEQPPQFHPEGDVWIHTLLLLSMLPAGSSRTLAWGALLHDVGKPPTFRIAPDRIRFDNHVEVGTRMAEEIGHRFRMSNDDISQIAALVANHLRFADVRNMKESTFKRFIRLPRFDEHLELHRIDCLGSHGILDFYQYTREKMANLPLEQIRPQPLITGHDLLAAGYQQGPRFKQILSAVEDAQLEGRLQSFSDAMNFVEREFPRSPEP